MSTLPRKLVNRSYSFPACYRSSEMLNLKVLYLRYLPAVLRLQHKKCKSPLSNFSLIKCLKTSFLQWCQTGLCAILIDDLLSREVHCSIPFKFKIIMDNLQPEKFTNFLCHSSKLCLYTWSCHNSSSEGTIPDDLQSTIGPANLHQYMVLNSNFVLLLNKMPFTCVQLLKNSLSCLKMTPSTNV